MKPPADQDESLLQKLVESAKRHDDSKSIFGLLLLLEREIRSEAQHRSVPLAAARQQEPFQSSGANNFQKVHRVAFEKDGSQTQETPKAKSLNRRRQALKVKTMQG